MTNKKAVIDFMIWAAAQNTSQCIIWPYKKTSNKYGLVGFLGRSMSAHRAVLILKTGVIQSLGMEASHNPNLCNNKLCVNPAHLRWASHAENISDKKIAGTELTGELNPQSKLTEHQVRQILKDTRTDRDAAKDYGVSPSTIGRVRRRECWAHVSVDGVA